MNCLNTATGIPNVARFMPETHQNPEKTILWLVRHGQTDWNLEGRYQGQADTPLNPAGIVEAGRAARQLAERPFQMVYSSDLQRAHRTAEVIAQASNQAPMKNHVLFMCRMVGYRQSAYLILP